MPNLDLTRPIIREMAREYRAQKATLDDLHKKMTAAQRKFQRAEAETHALRETLISMHPTVSQREIVRDLDDETVVIE